MSWKREGDRVTIEMSAEDWQRLELVMAIAAGAGGLREIHTTRGHSLFVRHQIAPISGNLKISFRYIAPNADAKQ